MWSSGSGFSLVEPGASLRSFCITKSPMKCLPTQLEYGFEVLYRVIIIKTFKGSGYCTVSEASSG